MKPFPDNENQRQKWGGIQQKAEEIIRLGRTRKTFGLVVRALALPVLLLVGISLLGLWAAQALWLGFFLLLATAFSAPVLAYLWPVSQARIWQLLDHQSPQPDLAVAAAEFLQEAPSPLADETVRRAINHFSNHPPTANNYGPSLSIGSKVGAFALVATFLLFPFIAIDPAQPELSAQEQQRRQNVQEIASYYEVWQEISAEFDSMEWEQLETFLKDRSETLDPETTDVRELFRQFQQIEDRLARLSAQLSPANIGEAAAALAQGLKDRPRWDAVAEAFAGNNFAATSQALENRSADLRNHNEPEANFPLTAEDADIFDLAAGLCEQAGEEAWAEAFRDAADAIRNEDLDGFCDALDAMAGLCEAEEQKRQQQQAARAMAQQLEENQQALAEQRQIAQARDPRAGQEEQIAQSSPGNEGEGIGTGTDDTFGWGDGVFDADFLAEHLQGVMSADGDSEERTIAGQESTNFARQGHREIDPAEFSQLSREAIENEEIPLAHRESVRRYFEGIRPASSDE